MNVFSALSCNLENNVEESEMTKEQLAIHSRENFKKLLNSKKLFTVFPKTEKSSNISYAKTIRSSLKERIIKNSNNTQIYKRRFYFFYLCSFY